MLIQPNTDVTAGSIVAPDGTVASRPTVMLTAEEAALLRQYKKFLAARGLREALYCNDCWSGDREDGCKAFVTDNQVGIFCRCRMRVHLGASY